MPDSEQQQSRFKRVLQAVNPNATDWAWYYPEKQFDPEFLLNWLAR